MSEPEMMDVLFGVFGLLETGELDGKFLMPGRRRGRPWVSRDSGSFSVLYESVRDGGGGHRTVWTLNGRYGTEESCLEGARAWASKVVSEVAFPEGDRFGLRWEEMALWLGSAGFMGGE